jgi:peptidoglycan glycosyltransferase
MGALMRPTPTLLPLACALLLSGAAARAESGTARPEAPLAPVSARPDPAPAPPAPLELLDLLPPGARAPGSAEPATVEVEYTVDPELDRQVRSVLSEGRVLLGHVIVMDPRSGAVLSYVSTAPESFPATRTYPTASLMKVVTAAAVLRDAPEATKRGCRYEGSPYHVRPAQLQPPREGGRVDSFWRALAISNNQCFARLAVHEVGREGLLDEMERAGLLEAPGPGHAPGRVLPVHSDLELGHLGSGLAGSFISPLAAVRLAGLLARGELVEPHWLGSARDASGRALALPALAPPRPVWPSELAAELRELMVGVVSRGTAKSAFRDPRGRPLLGSVHVAGKTGSLSGRDPKGRYEWFIGVAPAEAPSVAIAAVVVNGAVWWRNASQVAAEVLKGIFCGRGVCESDAPQDLLAAARARDARRSDVLASGASPERSRARLQ